MNQVTQANAASAEESASASQELNAQVEQVNGIIRELFAIVGDSNGAHNRSIQVTRKANHMVETLQPSTAGLFHPRPRGDQVRAIAQALMQEHRKAKKPLARGWPARKDPEEVIPLQEGEGKEKDEEILSKF